MRKSGWAAAAGIASAALLLTACGGSSGSAAAGGSTPSTSAAATSTGSGTNTQPNAKPSSGGLSSPAPGTIFFIVQKSAKGYVMAEAAGQVVYTYAGDTAGKAATCTGSCASAWAPVMGLGMVSPADNYTSKFGKINGQVTWNGLPLYTKVGAVPFSNSAGGQWKDIPLPLSDVIAG
jgi:predicted lipoprotein with Yx(FWY)xxD motif